MTLERLIAYYTRNIHIPGLNDNGKITMDRAYQIYSHTYEVDMDSDDTDFEAQFQ